MAQTCIACGMPMDSRGDHAKADVTRPFCRHCAREDGSMQSYPEKLAGYANFLAASQGLEPTVARKQAAAILDQLPAWKNAG